MPSTTGTIKRNTRVCVRCEDEPAQPPTASVFALGTMCLVEVMPRGTYDEQRAQYADLIKQYGYRD